MENAFASSAEHVALRLNVDPNLGLTSTQARLARKKYGPNSFPEEPPVPLWKLVAGQFQDKLAIVLLVSAVVSFILAVVDNDGEQQQDLSAYVDPVVILAILVLNAIVGVRQEKGAEESIRALSEYTTTEAKVLRNRAIVRVKASELVPGDIIDLSVGDSAPADCRLYSISSHSFLVDQSILTGESESVAKSTAAVPDLNAVKQDQTNMVFSGTTVTSGHARAIVVLTGLNTAVGDIHRSILSQISEPTPMKQKLDDFGDLLAKIISIICILVWVININKFWDPAHGGWVRGAIYYFKIAIALAVAAIPEGLAVVITTCLALGTKKMAARNAIVRNLPSVETLGSTSVICSDKTGTLTTNQMCVSNLLTLNPDGSSCRYSVSGNGFAPDGEIQSSSGQVLSSPYKNAPLRLIAEISALCNESELTKNPTSGSYGYIGEPTEAALRVLVEKIGSDSVNTAGIVTPSPVNREYVSRFTLESTQEFSRDRKSMSVLLKSGSDHVLFVKGAPERILSQSIKYYSESGEASITDEIRRQLLSELAKYSRQGLRVMALALRKQGVDVRSIENSKTTEDFSQIEQELTFVGFVAMRDPPRPGVNRSVETCLQAGIRIVMVTGDSLETAEAICRQVGIIGGDESSEGLVYTGKQLEQLTDGERLKVVQRARLFARVEPGHKTLLVKSLQALGHVVAVTGDGVNDAPALKRADIGVAMGGGTDVAKFAADMVLADDNFNTIEAAIEEGRAIYCNAKQFIRYLISSNIGEVVSIFLTALLGLPEALVPVQLLWVNLVTDGLPATALGFNPPDNEVMVRPPRPRNERLVSGWLFMRYLLIGTYVGAATVFGYVWWFVFYDQGPRLSYHELVHGQSGTMASDFHGSTMSLTILVVIEMLNALNSVSESDSLLSFPAWRNMYLIYAILLSMILHWIILYVPLMQSIFSTVPLDWHEWAMVMKLSVPVILLDEVLKLVERASSKPSNALTDKTK